MILFNAHKHTYSYHPKIIELINQYPHEFDSSIPFYSIGIHPLYIDKERLKSDIQTIEEKIILPGCLAIGECGLDKRSKINIEIQKIVFKNQLILAEKNQKPLIIHCVHAFHEIIEMKKSLKISVPMIIHGYSRNIELAKQLINNGFYLSFGLKLIENNKLMEVFKEIPLTRIFLETDVMENIEKIYNCASLNKNIKINELIKTIQNNFENCFKKKLNDIKNKDFK